MLRKRSSGILLHISSLPSSYGIGDLGPEAYSFADFLADSGQSIWQVLPLNPINASQFYSPYSSVSAFAANTAFISPDKLIEDGFLEKKDIAPLPDFSRDYCEYEKVIPYKEGLLDKAFENFEKKNLYADEFENFCSDNEDWLCDFSLFSVIKKVFKDSYWGRWDTPLRGRLHKALNSVKGENPRDIKKVKFLQFVFYRQWKALRRYCNKKGILLFGDIPIYVSLDSADVWAHPDLFKLDKNKNPRFVAGVPPDYFSKTGQLWGNPVYKWNKMKENGYHWWARRLEHNFKLFDLVRIDHFRGLVAFWQVPSEEETAVNGKWVGVPADDFFNTLKARFPDFPVIAEDLGSITDDVRDIMRKFKIPGMKILLFAFGEDNPEHPYLPENYKENCLVYTGTHDNNTARGWFENEAQKEEKARLEEYLGHKVSPHSVSWDFIRLAVESKANMVILPIQDVLSLGEKARMNVPGTTKDNWRWRLCRDLLRPANIDRLREISYKNARAPKRH